MFGITDPRQILTLPGSGFFSFPDEWAPVLTTNRHGYSSRQQRHRHVQLRTGHRPARHSGLHPGPASRQPPGIGYGSNPFIDIGAYQYVNLHPPEVTAVTETPTQGATPVNFYTVGGTCGREPDALDDQHHLQRPDLCPARSTPARSQLVDLGSNPSQPLDEDINLSGKLSYDSATDTLVINLAAAGLTLGTDAYQITLFGSGSPVITNPQGVALDGENTVGDTSTGAQLALPSGNGYPGGNFYDSFIINTTPPAVVPGSLHMDPASDTNIVGDNITMSTLPTFDGTISEPNPTLVPVAGQTVILDIGIELMVNGVSTTYFSTTRCPGRPAISSSAGRGHRDSDDRRRLPGHGGSRRGQHRARHQHQPPCQPVRHLQRRRQRRLVASARHRQRLLRGTGPDHRPERQPVEPDRSQRPGAVRRR